MKRHAKELASRPFWVFSSGPFGENPDPSWSEPPRTIERAEQLGVRDHVVFGGRLPLEASNFMERAMVRDLGSTNGSLLNGQRVAQAALEPDSTIRIGRTTGDTRKASQ